jgi:hypothetical protein
MIRSVLWSLVGLSFWAFALSAQTLVDLRTQSKSVDFENAPTTKPLKTGTALPATCAQGEMFFLTTAPAGANIYGCNVANIWTVQTGGGAGSSSILDAGTAVGIRPILDFYAGQGEILAISDTGTEISIQTTLDTSYILTRASQQSGASLYCNSASGSGTTYTCAMSPTLTVYTSGMMVHWKPDVNGTGGPTTLNLDTLGAMSVKLADGVSDPGPGDFLAGRMQELWYDGAVFRSLHTIAPAGQLGTALLCSSASGSATTYTCAMSPTLKSYTLGMVLRWKPDLSGGGAPTTLNVDTLGAVSVKLPDGTTDPASGDLVAGRLQEVWYDGTVFRILNSHAEAGVLGEAQPACSVTVRGRLWFVAGLTGVKDGLTVCAKDASNTYAWRTLY